MAWDRGLSIRGQAGCADLLLRLSADVVSTRSVCTTNRMPVELFSSKSCPCRPNVAPMGTHGRQERSFHNGSFTARTSELYPSHALSASLTDGRHDCQPPATSARAVDEDVTGQPEQHAPIGNAAHSRSHAVEPAAAAAAAGAVGSAAGAPRDKGAPGRPVPPQNFCCPISMDIMSDPVMIATGHTYDRCCIEKWLVNGHRTCPMSGQRLRHSELTPNIALRNIIQVRQALLRLLAAANARKDADMMPRLTRACLRSVSAAYVLRVLIVS